MTQDRKLLEPISTVSSVALRLLMALLIAAFILSTVHGWGNGNICVTDWTSNSSSAARGFVPEPGATAGSVPRYCAENATNTQHILVGIRSLASLILSVGGLFLLNRLLRSATREGVHTPQTAAGLRLLGWWLLVGSVVAQVIAAIAQTALLATLAQDAHLTGVSWLEVWNPPYLAVLTGLGILTFARITRSGSKMREDLEGLV
ncbi:hypothetical protein ACFVW8_12035 [Streptomyces sp. NPDC058221]|uniref:hypothetical protein n=1 Tax=Streptomyces sp. NPDC058221 TaxID=3346388 RepID=UPI0036E90589